MRFQVLGRLAVCDAAGREVPIAGPARRRVLAALLARPGVPVSAATLIDDLWGSAPPRSAATTLRSHVMRLREGLAAGTGNGLLHTVGDGYRLAVAPEDVDAGRFVRLIDEAARARDPAVAIARYDEALALWSDEAYVEFPEASFAVLERVRLGELRALARERRTDLALDVGRSAELIGELEQRVRLEPYRERGWEQLAVALYRAGRQADALAACRRARHVLLDDLGVEPGPGLRQLETRLLNHDGSLAPPAGSAAADPAARPAASGAPEQPERCPYLGLAGYEERDAALFVGRERLTSTVAARLADQAVVLVIGASGAGKSSLVRAGLLPALRAGALPGSSAWRMAVTTPGAALPPARSDGRPDLLVVDQAEELFTTLDADQRENAVAGLTGLVAAGSRVLVVLRSDFFGRLAEVELLAAAAGQTAVLVGPMRDDELRRTVVEPAAAVGLRCEDDLVETILQDVAGQGTALPLLSVAMVRTWDRRDGNVLTLEAYRRAAQVSGALEAVAEECYASLDESQRRTARHLLVRMAVRTPNGWVSQPVTGAAPTTTESEDAAVAALVQARLVVAGGRRLALAHDALLVHWGRLREWLAERALAAELLEHLARAAAAWWAAGQQEGDLYRGARLAAAQEWWAEHPEDVSPAEAEFLRRSARLAEAELAAARDRAARETKARRRLQRVAAALAVTALVAAAGIVVAFQERGTARRESGRAHRVAIVADARRLAALSLAAPDTATGAQLAVAAYRLADVSETRNALLDAVERPRPALWRLETPHRLLALAATPDGTRLVASDGAAVMAVDPVQHRAGKLTGAAGHLIGLSADGRSAVLWQAADEGPAGVSVVDVATGRRLTGGLPSAAVPALSSDRRWLAVLRGGARGQETVEVRDVAHWSVRHGYHPSRAVVALAAGRNVLAVAAADGSIELRSLPQLRLLTRMAVAPNAQRDGISLSPDGRWLAERGPNGGARVSVTVFDTRSPHRAVPMAFRSPVGAVAAGAGSFSPDSTELAIGSPAGALAVCRVADGAVVHRFAGNGGELDGVTWAGSGAHRALYSGGLDGEVVSWDLATSPRLFAESGPEVPEPSGVDAYGEAVLGGGHEGTDGGTAFWVTGDLRTGRVASWPLDLRVGEGDSGRGADERGRYAIETVADAAGNNRSVIWDLHRRRIVSTLQLPRGTGRLADGLSSTLSRDGRFAYAGLTATRVGVFAVPSGRYLRSFAVRFPHAPARFVVRPRDVDRRGRLVVWGDPENGPDDRLGLVDPTSGRLVAQARLGDIAFLFGLGWSHDGRWLGLATFNRNVILLDARTLRIRARVAAAQQGSLRSVSFSPDDTTLVAGSDDGSLNFWNVPDLSAGPGPIVLGHGTAFAWFSPTGRIVGLAPDPARPGRERWFVLAADPASLANAACGLAGGGLTPAQWRRYAVAESYRPTCPAVR